MTVPSRDDAAPLAGGARVAFSNDEHQKPTAEAVRLIALGKRDVASVWTAAEHVVWRKNLAEGACG